MKAIHRSSALLLAAVSIGTIARGQTTQPAEPSVKIGSTAPALDVANWYKGEPVKAFEPGNIYVVEFWATWCGPCKKSIPHLTELQKEYAGKVTIIGVDVWERPDDETDAGIAAEVKPFVARMADQMAYTVAGDGIGKKMATTWMEAAGRDSIPTAFIVGKDGKIEWIGFAAEITQPLKSVVDGTWDRVAEAKAQQAARQASAVQSTLIKAYFAAKKAGDPVAMQKAFDQLSAADPKLANGGDGISIQFDIDLLADQAKAVAYAQSLIQPGGAIDQKPEFVWSILRVLPEQPGKVSVGTLKSIASAYGPFLQNHPVHYVNYSSYARLADNVGKPAEAVTYQQKAIAGYEAFLSKQKMPPEADKGLTKMKADLQAYQTHAGSAVSSTN